MQESVTEKTIAFIIRGEQMTAALLRNAIQRYQQNHRVSKANKARGPTQEYKGKQSLKKLKESANGNISDIEITDKNIKAFDRHARKYKVDYALKKDKSVDPPRWLVFFKAKDADSLQAAFREFTTRKLKKQERPSIREQLRKFKEQVKNRVQTRAINKDRGLDR